MREVLLMEGSVFAFRLSRPVRGWSRASPSPPLAGRWVSLACASVGCRRSVPFRRPSCGCSGFARSFAALFGFRSVRAFAVVGGVVGLFVAGRVAGWSRPFGRRWVCGRPRFSLAGASVPCRFGLVQPDCTHRFYYAFRAFAGNWNATSTEPTSRSTLRLRIR